MEAVDVAEVPVQAAPLLQVRGLSKAFGGVFAANEVDLDLASGEILGLVGENGAGKSTVVKMLSGTLAPDAGEISLDGEALKLHGARAARAAGISVIHQELALIDTFSVAENVFLGEPYPRRNGAIAWGQMREEARAAFAALGHEEVDVTRPVSQVPVWERWFTEVVRGLRERSRVLVLDEPTAAMEPADVDKLFAAIRALAAAGTGVIIVSHRIGELLSICDRVQVMRDGRSVAIAEVSGLDAAALIGLITGDEKLGETASGGRAKAPANGGDVVLSVSGLRASGEGVPTKLEVRAGEVVGVAGLVGSGRSTLLRQISGAGGQNEISVAIDGVEETPGSPRAALERGIVMLPEDRLREGLVGGLPVAANIKLGRRGAGRLRGLIGRRREEEHGRRWIDRLSIRGAAPRGPWEALSGGNQQKVLFARALDREPRLLVLDEPTRGVDVGARAELHGLVRSFATEQGGGVLVATSDLDELCDLCDRAIVLRERQVVGELAGDALTRDQILRACYEH